MVESLMAFISYLLFLEVELHLQVGTDLCALRTIKCAGHIPAIYILRDQYSKKMLSILTDNMQLSHFI